MSYCFTAIDFETTGLNPYSDRITEIAALRYRRGRIVAEFVTLIDPQRNIPEFLERKIGITNDMVRGRPIIEDKIEELCEFLGDDLLVAHNTKFDLGFLNANVERVLGKTIGNETVCTLDLAGRNIENLGSYALQSVCDYLGIHRDKAHRAKDDAMAAAELYMRIMREKKAGRVPIVRLEQAVSF